MKKEHEVINRLSAASPSRHSVCFSTYVDFFSSWIMFAAHRPSPGGEVCMQSFVNSSLFSCGDVVHFIRCLSSYKKPCANIGLGDEVILYPRGILMSSRSGQEAVGAAVQLLGKYSCLGLPVSVHLVFVVSVVLF